MARQQGYLVQNKPISGLITEQTSLSFGDNACVEIWNTLLDDQGRVSRRLGLEPETDYMDINITKETNGEVFTEHMWQNPGGDSSKKFLVQQVGSVIRFFDVSDSDTVGDHHDQELLLSNFLPSGSGRMVQTRPASYASGHRDLVVTHPYTNPVLVTYNSSIDTITFQAIITKIRDFEGLPDNSGIAFSTRPAITITTAQTTYPNYAYNLYNRAWHTTTALGEWDAARADLPNLYDMPVLYRASPTDPFDNALVSAKSPGNTLSPGGHLILNAFTPSRRQALIDDGITGVLPVENLLVRLDTALGTKISSAGTPTLGFDTNQNTLVQEATPGVDFLGLGIDLTGIPSTVQQIRIDTNPWSGFYQGNPATVNLRVELYGHNAPPNATWDNGTLLGLEAWADHPSTSFVPISTRVVGSNDIGTPFEYIWVKLIVVGGVIGAGHALRIGELYVFPGVFSANRPSSSAFYAGRLFLSSPEGARASGIYFSQIVKNSSDYEKSYQANDPTSQEVSELLSSDGGFIDIPELGSVTKMIVTFGALLVFATNGIWQIEGSSGQPFRANDYTVKRISNVGTRSPNSFVVVSGIPIWWSENGIDTVEYDPRYGSFSVKSITQQTVQSFIDVLPTNNKYAVKGAYSLKDKRIYWMYSDSSNFSQTNPVYNRMLCMNVVTGAFFPWTLPSGTTQQIAGITSLVNINASSSNDIKVTTRVNYNTSNPFILRYSEFKSATYHDWEGTADDTNYESYVITGYKLDGDAQRKIQLPYVTVFTETLEDSSLFVQCIYDAHISPDQGKWSVPQQCYNPNSNTRFSMRRLKMRGNGRSIQFKYFSEDGKPFILTGWAVWETGNANL